MYICIEGNLNDAIFNRYHCLNLSWTMACYRWPSKSSSLKGKEAVINNSPIKNKKWYLRQEELNRNNLFQENFPKTTNIKAATSMYKSQTGNKHGKSRLHPIKLSEKTYFLTLQVISRHVLHGTVICANQPFNVAWIIIIFMGQGRFWIWTGIN